jgi:hypothetical protein
MSVTEVAVSANLVDTCRAIEQCTLAGTWDGTWAD